MRALADVAGPHNEAELCRGIPGRSVRELVEVARDVGRAEEARAPQRSEPVEERRSARFNDAHRTLSVQLGALAYAETRAHLEARVETLPSDPETRLDVRLADAFVDLVRGAAVREGEGSLAPRPYVIVAHVGLGALVGETGAESPLAGELAGQGLVDLETLRQVACDATVVLGVDDDVGHTMYEGRARRLPSETQRREVLRRDRHCRFPGCRHLSFAHVHHVVAWKPGGRTDLDNLVLLCRHHHGLVHRNGWSMSGNANEELTISGPSGRVMTSRPSPLWTRVSGVGGAGP